MIYSKNAGYLVISLLLLLAISCSTTKNTGLQSKKESGWELIKEDETGCKIYSKETTGTKIRAFMVEGPINSEPKNCLYWVKDKILRYEKYDKNGAVIEVLDQTDKGLLTYSISKMPWPVKDREMCERYEYYEEEDKGILGIKWKEAWEECPKPLNKKMVRMPIIRGKWEFTSTGSNSCKAVYLAQFDPGKGMPAGMVNSMAGKFLVEEFNSIKTLSEKNERNETNR